MMFFKTLSDFYRANMRDKAACLQFKIDHMRMCDDKDFTFKKEFVRGLSPYLTTDIILTYVFLTGSNSEVQFNGCVMSKEKNFEYQLLCDEVSKEYADYKYRLLVDASPACSIWFNLPRRNVEDCMFFYRVMKSNVPYSIVTEGSGSKASKIGIICEDSGFRLIPASKKYLPVDLHVVLKALDAKYGTCLAKACTSYETRKVILNKLIELGDGCIFDDANFNVCRALQIRLVKRDIENICKLEVTSEGMKIQFICKRPIQNIMDWYKSNKFVFLSICASILRSSGVKGKAVGVSTSGDRTLVIRIKLST